MEMAQKPPGKEVKRIYEIEKKMALTVFKKYWPDASIVFNEPKPIEPIVDKALEEQKKKDAELAEALKAEEEALAKEKADKKAKLEAELKALDES